MTVEPEFLDPESFGVDFQFRPIGETALLFADMRAIRHRRNARHIGRDGRDSFSFLFADAGELTFQARDQNIRVNRQIACIGSHDLTNDAEWRSRGRMFSIELTRDTLIAAGAPVDERVYRELPTSDPVLAILKSYAQMVWRLDPAVRWANRVRIDTHMADLTADVMRRSVGVEGGLVGDGQRLLAIRELIARNYADPLLSNKEAARQLNLSPAQIRSALSLVGSTFTRELVRYRLDIARTALIDADRRISDIALDCGFSDISYFNRLFRERFGMSPRLSRRSSLEH